MAKIIKLTEKDIESLVNKIIKEDSFPRGGTVFGGKAEIVDEVINRVNQYGDEYIQELNLLNSKFPSTKYKKIESPVKAEIPSGVRVKSTVYPNR